MKFLFSLTSSTDMFHGWFNEKTVSFFTRPGNGLKLEAAAEPWPRFNNIKAAAKFSDVFALLALRKINTFLLMKT